MGRDKGYPPKKVDYFKRMNKMLDECEKILIIGIENVTSAMLQATRMALRGKAYMLLGKNTMMKKVLAIRKESGNPRDVDLYNQLVLNKLINGNVGLLFTNADLRDIKAVLDKERIQAPARQGAVSPVDVIVPAGNTGLEPTKTAFFQALNINTKIQKGTVEILKDVQILTKGLKVGSSEAALLQMLNIKPFFYSIVIENIYDKGSIYGSWVLEVTDEVLAEKASAAVTNLTAVSLALGITNKASLPHVVINAFKNILSVSIATDYDFDSFDGKKLKEAVLKGPVAPAPGKPAAGAAPAKEEKAAAPPKEESDGEMGFGLFD
jgi:large subunit ribosomal protein LP0